MKPFLAYGWQPQVMAVEGRHKAIRAGRAEVYDVVADPGETRDLGRAPDRLAAAARRRCATIPLPSLGAPRGAAAASTRRRAASWPASATSARRRRAGRPPGRAAPRGHGAALRRPRARRRACSCARSTRGAIPLLEQHPGRGPPQPRRRAAPGHRALVARATTAQAGPRSRGPAAIAPESPDVRDVPARCTTRAGKEWARAAPLLERALAESPERLPVAGGAGARPRAAGTARRGARRCGSGSTRCARPTAGRARRARASWP